MRVYASAPAGRVRLLAEVLSTLGTDDNAGLAWLSMAAGSLEKYDVRQEDLDGIEHVYEAFYTDGYRVRYSPAYDDLMLATDQAGIHRSYLATEANFAFVKGLESRNLVVPVVGDFGGPKAIRHIAAYLKARNATVSAFYLSNVEQYLDKKALDFCHNVSLLPLDSSSTFIRSSSGGSRAAAEGSLHIRARGRAGP